ncbi:MAG TPA: hypothetical protein PKH24_00990 [Sedimentisphaerales bacterium]|jgi:DNA-directed RNA polymerase subunit RPC12/RpoP|nr:hypothetical protein [Sedimentisphaerales bacterium]HNU27897.1 hypothetical protein [Sedimentisphaerales bacterium]
MTIEFNCPKCGALIAFDSKHAGKRAKCLSCGQKFLIPAESFQKPKKAEPEPAPKEDPIPGFYHAVFVDSFKVFVRPANVTAMAFVVAVVCFKFFLARGACCLNHVAYFIIWGWLFGFYLSLISRVAIDDDQLPEIDIGTSITFLLYILGPFFVFFVTLFLVETPFIFGLALSQDRGITFGNLFSGGTGLHRLLQVLLLGGLFLFPAAILTTAVGGTFLLLRPDYLLAPLRKAFLPYLTAFALLAATCILETQTTQYTGAPVKVTAAYLALNLLVQVVAIFAMRAIGLYYRHYGCHFKW